MGAQAVRLSNVDIDNALKNKDFEVLFQPIFDLGNGALARMEAFVRWRHPELGVLPPGAFISFFESQGRMSELTRYVLGRSLEHYVRWRGPYPPGISINLALSDFTDDAFVSHLTVLLREHGIPAEIITLECPMPAVDAPLDAAAENFKRLASTGARLAIEVRGRANDLLRDLDPFPFDEIKTGGAAILRFARTVRGPGLSAISELLDIASHAKAAITAVGVEDQASLAALRGLGFTAAQGNHLGKVGPLSAFLPSRVNEVRELLGLELLSADDLAALFRTDAASLKPTRSAKTKRPPTAARTASTAIADQKSSDRAPKAIADARAKTQAGRNARTAVSANQEAKEARAHKAAAIARAKMKAASKSASRRKKEAAETQQTRLALAETGKADAPGASAQSAAARKLQERLSEAFSQDQPPSDTKNPPNVEAPDEAREEPALEPAGAFEDVEWEEIESQAQEGGLAASADKPATEDPATSSEEIAAIDAEVDAIGDQSAAPMRAGSADEFGRASLSVGRVGAHFRPTLRVGGPQSPPPQAPPRKEREDDIVEIFLDDEQDAAAAPGLAPGDKAPAPLAPSPAAQEELALEPQPVQAAPAPMRRQRSAARRKNFLTRKYRVWPDHFWPRSWTRYWRNRQAMKTDRSAEGY